LIDLASCWSEADALMVVPGPIASEQFVSKDPDSVMAVTRAFSGKVESGSPGGGHRTQSQASSRNLLDYPTF
jgi:hypothetical protein